MSLDLLGFRHFARHGYGANFRPDGGPPEGRACREGVGRTQSLLGFARAFQLVLIIRR
jgi:hypothetical protein